MRTAPRQVVVAAEWAALALALGALGLLFVQDGGVRDPVLGPTLALISAVPLYLTAGAWRLPWWFQLGAAALPLSLALVALIHLDPVGGSRIARYAYFAVLLLGVTAFARTPRRRLIVAAGIAMVGLLLCMSGLGGMLASGDAGRYLDGGMWTNTFGAAMAMTAALGIGIAVLGGIDGRESLGPVELVALGIGWLAATVGIAGTVMSASRASLLLLGLAAAVLLALAVRARGVRGAMRWLLLVVLGAALTVLLRLPALLPALASIGGGGGNALESASGGSSPNPLGALVKPGIESSWSDRLEFWRIAWEMGLDRPLAGAGLSRFGSDLQICYKRSAIAADPHSELLRGWADGGIIALLPMLAAFLGVAVLIIVTLRMLGRRSAAARLIADPGRWAAPAGLAIAAGHLAIDFDWAYPAMIGLAALLAGLAAAPVVRLVRGHGSGTAHAAPWHILGKLTLVAAVIAIGLLAISIDPYAANPLIFTSFPSGAISCG